MSAGLREGTVLDVGGGLGILSLELLDAGFSRAVVVDASSAYLAAASEEASRRGRLSLTEFTHGDFLEVAGKMAPSNVVTLDRVVCCYPSYEPLLEQALHLANAGFAVSYPRDRRFVRLGMWLENALRRWRGNPFRTFVHARTAIEAFTRAHCGLASDTTACGCHRRVPAALRLGRVHLHALDFAQQPSSYQAIRGLVRSAEQARWALQVHRTSNPRASEVDFARRLAESLASRRDPPR